MNVAITVWGNRISPVFDSAQMLLVADVRGQKVVERRVQLFKAALFQQCLSLLQELDIRVLMCGALCEGPVRLLESQGIEVIPFVTGEAEEILQCYIEGRDLGDFAMPGCRYGRCCRKRTSIARNS